MILSNFELQLLLEKNIVSLLSKKGLLTQPNDEQQSQFRNFHTNHVAGQHEFLRANKINESKKFIADIIRGKERKLLKAGVKPEDIHLREDDVLDEISRSYEGNDDNALVQIPTQHPIDVGKLHSLTRN